jgi:hypothetical protein
MYYVFQNFLFLKNYEEKKCDLLSSPAIGFVAIFCFCNDVKAAELCQVANGHIWNIRSSFCVIRFPFKNAANTVQNQEEKVGTNTGGL